MAPSQFLCNGLDPAASANQGLRDRRTGCRPGRTRSIRMATPRSRWKRGTSGLGCWKTLAAHPEPSADVTRAGRTWGHDQVVLGGFAPVLLMRWRSR